MANKRRPVSFPELDNAPKGRGAILRSAEEVEAEQDRLANQEAGIPENKYSSKVKNKHSGIPDIQKASNRNEYQKATYRLSPEALEAIDEAKRVLRRKHKLKVALEEIAEEAIIAACNDLLENQETSMLVSKFSRKQA
jgi:hypothetical protein